MRKYDDARIYTLLIVLSITAVGTGIYLGKESSIVLQGVSSPITPRLPKSSAPVIAREHDIINAKHQTISDTDKLAEYFLSRDKHILTDALMLFPDNPDLLLEACLIAEYPHSPVLKEFEQLFPRNSLPNLIRAMLFAEMHDYDNFRKELRLAISKGNLFIDDRRRRSVMLDKLISLGPAGLDVNAYQSLDADFYRILSGIYSAFSDNPMIFGDEFYTAEIAVGLASQLRAMDKTSLSNELASIQFEKLLLTKLDPDDLYGNQGQTIAERLSELELQLVNKGKTVINYIHPLFGKDGDPILRFTFFTRVRADGEKASMNWLINEVKSGRSLTAQ